MPCAKVSTVLNGANFLRKLQQENIFKQYWIEVYFEIQAVL